jgi:putative transposase
MILTIKIKHNRDFSHELIKARHVAEYAIHNKNKLSTKYVKHIGLKSEISNQILRKYGRNKTIKEVHSVNLILPGRCIKVVGNNLHLIPIKLDLLNESHYNITKVNQIELDDTYAYVSFAVVEQPEIVRSSFIGVDLNTTGHCAVVANPATGKIHKLGAEAAKIHTKYARLRTIFQEQKRYRKIKEVRNSESRKVRNLNHKISRFIVNLAKKHGTGIKLEKLTGIRDNRKQNRSFRRALHSWSFYQLQQMIEYKAKLLGIQVIYISPEYTSQDCSRCHERGKRSGKKFYCESCGHCDHADVNAAFNIALSSNIYRDEKEIVENGSTDTPIKQFNRKGS